MADANATIGGDTTRTSQRQSSPMFQIGSAAVVRVRGGVAVRVEDVAAVTATWPTSWLPTPWLYSCKYLAICKSIAQLKLSYSSYSYSYSLWHARWSAKYLVSSPIGVIWWSSIQYPGYNIGRNSFVTKLDRFLCRSNLMMDEMDVITTLSSIYTVCVYLEDRAIGIDLVGCLWNKRRCNCVMA